MKSSFPLFALFIATALAAPAQTPQRPLPAGVKAHRDLAYVEAGHERQRLDLYLPEKTGAPVPVIVGAWRRLAGGQ